MHQTLTLMHSMTPSISLKLLELYMHTYYLSVSVSSVLLIDLLFSHSCGIEDLSSPTRNQNCTPSHWKAES